MNTQGILESKKTERWLIVGIVVAFFISLFLSSANPNNPDNIVDIQDVNSITDYEIRTIEVAQTTYSVLIADTQDKRTKGLSYRTELPDTVDGMLFVFDTPGFHSIWMKEMNFNLDIFWLDERFEIVHQEPDVSPDTFPESFTSQTPALYVLELPS